MSELQLKEIADNADMIIANYSFTVMENGDMIMSSMDDGRLSNVSTHTRAIRN